MTRRLSAEALRAPCDPKRLGFETTRDLEPLAGVIGQERALEAIAFGIGMKANGYNVFAVGPSATGKATMLNEQISRAALAEPTPPDWCYVHNIVDPYRPKALSLPPGRGRELRDALAQVATESRDRLARTFEGEEFSRRNHQLEQQAEAKIDEIMESLGELAERVGFAVSRSEGGFALVALHEGHPITPEEFEALTPAVRETLEESARELDKAAEPASRALRQLERESTEAREKLVREVATAAVAATWEALRKRFEGLAPVQAILSEYEKDLLDHAGLFLPEAAPDEDESEGDEGDEGDGPDGPGAAALLNRYRVNVIVDNGGRKGAPLVAETNPTTKNLFGRIERRALMGALVTDSTMIKPGALHAANGGYLLLEAGDLLEAEGAWGALKKALKGKQIRIEDAQEEGTVSAASLSPEPIPLQLKVVLMGPAGFYYPLYAQDDDFRGLFKVKVDFDDSLPRTTESERLVARFVATVAKEHNLRSYTAGAIARLVEQGSRIVGDQRRMSARLGEIVDLVREANYWAGQRGADAVEAEDFDRTLEKRRHRADLMQERYDRMVHEGEVLIDTAGARVGQVNGMAVISTFDHSFGRACRITARVNAGKPGVVDVEREVGLGGAIHTKGVLLLTGYLAGRYARGHRLAIHAWLAFEQSYDEVEGDSASCAELCALLSAISNVPISQSIAITGSVNQQGEVQTVGGVDEKIEGFFDLCRARGLDGSHAVVIPEANARHLMLRHDVLEAVRSGLFSVYAVRHIDEALALLTGRDPGQRGADGRFPAGSLNGEVERVIMEWGELDRATR